MNNYTIHGKLEEYKRCGYLITIDSEHNIFPSAKSCAEYHGVSPSTIYRDFGFNSKTVGKKVAVAFISTVEDCNMYDGNHMNELEQVLQVYDDLFNNYILKGIRADICSNGWAGPGNISVCGKRVINGVTVWSPEFKP